MFIARQKPAGSSFDPNMWDPAIMKKYNSATGDSPAAQSGQLVQGAKLGQKMQVNITLQNATAVTITFELWYYLNSMMRVLNPTFVTGVYHYIPQNSYEGIVSIAAGTDATVGPNAVGDVVIRGTLPATPVATIKCDEIAYASFFEASAVTPFVVSWFRYGTSSTTNQFRNGIKWKSKSYSGGIKENIISPLAYQDPKNQQQLILDIYTTFDIGIDRGLETKVLAGEIVTFALFISFWTNQTLDTDN